MHLHPIEKNMFSSIHPFIKLHLSCGVCNSGWIFGAILSSLLPWRLAEVIKGRIFTGLSMLEYLTERFQHL